MSNDQKYWARVVFPEIRRLTGHAYPELEKHLEELPVQVLMDLHRLTQDVQHEITQAKRSVQMWPGGPRLRI